MLTQLNIIHNQRGFTVSVSTTHQTYAGALAHFTELVADFTRDHYTAIRAAQDAAAGDAVATGVTELPNRCEGPGHNSQSIESATSTAPCLVATIAAAELQYQNPRCSFGLGHPIATD